MFPITTRVLVVDDSAVMRRMMRDFFRANNFKNVVDAIDGEAAWREIETAHREGNPFGLIISDWNMPKIDGLELLRMVRGTDHSQKTPFLMLTAETEKDKVVEALQSGVDNYITKPFTNDTVKAKLKMVWDKYATKKAS